MAASDVSVSRDIPTPSASEHCHEKQEGPAENRGSPDRPDRIGPPTLDAAAKPGLYREKRRKCTRNEGEAVRAKQAKFLPAIASNNDRTFELRACREGSRRFDD